MIKQRVSELRELLSLYNINGYIIPPNDEYMSEYPAEYAHRLTYITGFTGSNGIAVILVNAALFFTDGRYLEQSRYELDDSLFQIYDLKQLRSFNWQAVITELKETRENKLVIGYDPQLFNAKMLQAFSCSILTFQPLDINLIDKIWLNKPLKPSSEVSIYPLEFAGQPHNDKINICRQTLKKYEAEALVVTAVDSICWLLNLRASDTLYSPLMLSSLILTNTHVYLFIDPQRIPQSVNDERPEITFLAENSLPAKLLSIEGKVLVDESSTNLFIMSLLGNKQVEKIIDPCQILKACKNAIELSNAASAHVKDAIAVCEFLSYAARSLPAEITEYELGQLLTSLRRQHKEYVMDSFPTICGFQENSAIIHYRATQSAAKQVNGQGLLLVDSGGQYMGATTDITRTIVIGNPTTEQKKRYTQVLKGHLALSAARFPGNVSGACLDILARQFLWQDCEDYPHSTGHGVGNFLNVHEGPQNISLYSNITLKSGMVVSNEPGYYLHEKFGIRIENLMYIKPAVENSNYLEFENLTLVPYCQQLIEYSSLTIQEITCLKLYYQRIHTKVYPFLSPLAKKWLLAQIQI